MKHDPLTLKQLREGRGMTQEKLALLSKVSERTVQRAEAGQAMSLETLNEFAAALEVPLSHFARGSDPTSPDKMIPLRRVVSARLLLDDLGRAGVVSFDCKFDPGPDELRDVLNLIGAIEARLPVPWDVNERPPPLRLGDKVELTSKFAELMSKAETHGVGLFFANAWIRAQYPYYDPEECVTGTHGGQPYQNVMTMQLLLCRSLKDKVYDTQVGHWGLDVEPARKPPPAFDSASLDDDVPF